MTWRLGMRRLLDALILLLTIWLLGAAAYVTLGRLLVPIAADYREELVAEAESRLGRAISVETLSGEMQGSQPVLRLQSLRVHATPDPASPVLFELDAVSARLDVFTSLWRRQMVLDALQIEGLALEVVEHDDGRWALQGLGNTGQLQPDAEAVLDLLGNLRRITLLDTQIRIRPQDLPAWEFTEGDLTLLSRRGRHRLDARIGLPDGEIAEIQLRLQRARAWQDSALAFYADLPPLQWSQWLPSEWLESASINQLTVGGRYWGELDQGRLLELRGELDAPLLALQTEGAPQQFERVQARFELQLENDRQGLQVEGLSWQLGEEIWPASRLQARRNLDPEGAWQVAVDRLPLAWLGLLLPAHLADERAAQLLQQAQPRGVLRDLQIAGKGREFEPAGWRLSARLDGVGLEPIEAVPGFDNISGTLAGTLAEGSLRLNSRGWSMHLPRLFEHPWRYDHLLGELAWQWSAAEGLRLKAPGLLVQGEQGRGAARLNLHLPRPEETASMELQVALRDSAATYHRLYLPTRAPAFSPALDAWLADAELAGRVPLAIFRYMGSIEREVTEGDRSLELYATLEDGHVRYQPDWPALEQVYGTLRLRDRDLSVERARARLWDTELSEVSVEVQRPSAEEPLQLVLQGHHQGPLGDALRIGQETPVFAMTRELLAGWRGEGRLAGTLALRLPLQPGAVANAQMNWQLDAEQLWIPQLQAPLGQVRGELSFIQGQGLAGEGLSLNFLGQPVTLDIERDAGRQSLLARGSHDIAALRSWPLLGGVPLEVAEGAFDWQAEADFETGRQRVRVTSDLQGVALALPGPLAKPADAIRPAQLDLRLEEGAQRWSLALGDELQAGAEVRDSVIRADIRYRDGPPRALPDAGIALGARFVDFDLAAWQTWYQNFVAGFDETLREGGPTSSVTLQQIALHAEHFTGMGRELADASLSAQRLGAAWHLKVEQADVAGTLVLPDDDSAPWVVDLQRLRFERPAQAELNDTLVEPLVEPVLPQDPLEGVRPSRLPALDVRVQQIIWGEDPVAEARFRLRPHDSGALIEDLQLELRGGLTLGGQIDWREEAGRSQFNGALSAVDIGEVLQAWRYAPTLTSSRFEANADLTWPGSPAFFALKRATGELQLKARDGVVQSGEGSAEALRIFGLLNFNALTRRLRLDFSDIFGRGTAYDSLDTQLVLSDGLLQTRSPLIMDGPSARIELDGLIDLPQDRIDMGMLVTLPLSNNLPLAAVLVGAPYLGGALFIVDRILGDRISRIASVKYRVSGDWQQPTVEFDRAFDNKAALEE